MAITIASRDGPGSGAPASIARMGARARAFAAAQRHSRLVRLLRIALPLAAGGIFCAFALYVAAKWHLETGKFKFGPVTITADDLTMKDPTFFDVTSDGRYEVRAKRAVVAFSPQNAPVKLIDVSGELYQTSGTTTKLKAKHGLYEKSKGELELFDGIEIDGTNGLVARLSRAMIYSKQSKVVSEHPVSAIMPTGSVQALAMTLHTKSRLAEFRGEVSVRLVSSAQSTGIGGNARQPVDVRSEQLDVDDAQKTAHFRGKVVAIQGETMLQAPYLKVKYEGKAAATLTSGPKAPAGQDGTRVTLLAARDGVEITAGNDRRITSEQVDFDVAADTALFEGKVVATQEKNVVKGERLFVDRKAGTSRLETPGDGGRIAATFHQAAGSQAQRKKPPAAAEALQTIGGSFKNDPDAPMEVDADTLDVLETAKKAVFKGDVRARQGEMLLLASELTAFFSGTTGLGLATAADDTGAKAKGQDKGQVVRLEAKDKVLLTSKDGQTASANKATFDVKANTAVLVGDTVNPVVVTKPGNDPRDPTKQKITVLEAPRLKIDMTTGVYWMEADPTRTVGPPPDMTKGPATSSSPPTTSSDDATKAEGRPCAPGKVCGLIYPNQVKDKALDALKKKAPAVDAR
jgi:lipopolysaccharide export system protein LptA